MSGMERSPTGFSAAVSESEFERMKDSQHITIHDWTPLGPMPDWDYFVSFGVPTTAVSGASGHRQEADDDA